MKNNKIKKILFLLVMFTMVMACKDESKDPVPDYFRSAIPLFERNTDDSGIINLLEPAQTKVSFTLNKEGLAAVKNIDVLITFNNSISGESETVVFSTEASFPSSIVITQAQLIEAFEPEFLTQDTLSIGDSFVIGGAVRLENGTYLNGGYSTSVFTDHPVTITYNVSCTSSIAAGAYTAVTTASSTDDCPVVNPIVGASHDVTITANGAGVYRVSEFFAGAYKSFYGACYGYTFNTPANFTDVCNNLSFSFEDGFGAAVEGTGTYDPGTGIITYTWENEFGDTGTVVLTHK
jgi:hypothetical protein